MKYRHSVILGDFNADMMVDTYDSTQLKSFISSSNMYLVPYETTHHLKNSSTFLDLCIVDDGSKLENFGQMAVPFLSAHNLIHNKYQINIKRHLPRLVLCRNFKNFNERNFLAEVNGCDWSDLMSSNCIDEKVDMFNNKLLGYFNKHP